MNRLLATVLLLTPAIVRAESAFEGTWAITTVAIDDKTVERARAEEMPTRIELREGKDGLLALYTNRSGETLPCKTAGPIENYQNEILLGCTAPFARDRPRRPNLRIILNGQVLNGTTIHDRLHYKWVAERQAK